MVLWNKRQPAPRLRDYSAASRYEFVEMLRLNGATLGVPHCHRCKRGSWESQAVVLTYPRDTWEKLFGPLENVTCHFSPPGGFFHTWEHYWKGGWVRCVGSLTQHPDGTPWLAVKWAMFFDGQPPVPVSPEVPHDGTTASLHRAATR